MDRKNCDQLKVAVVSDKCLFNPRFTYSADDVTDDIVSGYQQRKIIRPAAGITMIPPKRSRRSNSGAHAAWPRARPAPLSKDVPSTRSRSGLSALARIASRATAVRERPLLWPCRRRRHHASKSQFGIRSSVATFRVSGARLHKPPSASRSASPAGLPSGRDGSGSRRLLARQRVTDKKAHTEIYR